MKIVVVFLGVVVLLLSFTYTEGANTQKPTGPPPKGFSGTPPHGFTGTPPSGFKWSPPPGFSFKPKGKSA
ncbi:hypothetical protein OESDEN_05409 [Oesophagostomum dentatum]|uniref:Uncharacterized protein n=1 Tax=Oesophagostomum dentatum TaxID=61180 RepID=A0A0B1TF11_OESDE|nr:hypothetical protein OESDEN_05409 [Oesophagostomum dentatum]